VPQRIARPPQQRAKVVLANGHEPIVSAVAAAGVRARPRGRVDGGSRRLPVVLVERPTQTAVGDQRERVEAEVTGNRGRVAEVVRFVCGR